MLQFCSISGQTNENKEQLELSNPFPENGAGFAPTLIANSDASSSFELSKVGEI